MKIYAMSDIHGEYEALLEALNNVDIKKNDSKLVFLGDYIHKGPQSKQVLDKIIALQEFYGSDKIVTLKGNHEDFVLMGEADIDKCATSFFGDLSDLNYQVDEKYINFFQTLLNYHVEGNTIFVHAGINEEAGNLWELGTPIDWYAHKYPADIGYIPGLNKKIVAGHVGTCDISNDPSFHEIFYDGKSHYYIDGTTNISGVIPVIMVDTETDKYFDVTNNYLEEIYPYE